MLLRKYSESRTTQVWRLRVASSMPAVLKDHTRSSMAADFKKKKHKGFEGKACYFKQITTLKS